jgi:hypothetical protein
MKIVAYEGSSEASGSQGGITVSRNRWGMYIRPRRVPVNPSSSRQQLVRSLLANLTSNWDTGLTPAQRAAWSLYGENVAMKDVFGRTIYLTGLNHYVRSNVALQQAGLTRVDDGPTIFDLPESDPTLSIAAAEASSELTITYDDTRDWCDEDGGALIITCGAPQNPTINYYGGPWKFTDSEDGDSVTPPTSPGTMTSPYALTAGQRQFYRARIVRADGRLSGFFRPDPATVS